MGVDPSVTHHVYRVSLYLPGLLFTHFYLGGSEFLCLHHLPFSDPTQSIPDNMNVTWVLHVVVMGSGDQQNLDLKFVC